MDGVKPVMATVRLKSGTLFQGMITYGLGVVHIEVLPDGVGPRPASYLIPWAAIEWVELLGGDGNLDG